MSSAQYPSLKGKVVWITGGASGMGGLMVREFARQGAVVGFVDIDDTTGKSLARELTDAQSQVQFEPCALRSLDALKAAFERLESKLGPAEVLVNNAANDDRH